MKFWHKKRLIFKIFLGAMVVFLVPVGVISHLTFRHLDTIKEVSLQEARSALATSQVDFLRNHLAQKAEKISTEFTHIRNQVNLLGSLSRSIFEDPSRFRYRNGSRYRFVERGDYVNPLDDGNSSLYVPRYRPGLDPLVAATESLDIVLKPLVDLEPRVVLGWFIHKDLVSRTYPWRDFRSFPRSPEVTSWPFYYLADPAHNPTGEEVFTPVYTDPLSGDNMISCLSPVLVEGQHVATVGVDITVETLLEEIRQVHLSEGSSSLLIAHGEIVAASENLPLAMIGLDPERPPSGQKLDVRKLSATGKVVTGPKPGKISVEFIETEEVRAFVGHAEMDPLGWRLFLLVPEEDLLGPVNRKAQAIFAEAERIRGNFVHILVIAIVATASLSYLVISHQSRGLRTLLGGIREFGDGNLKHRLREDSGEFGQLSQALNTMAESLLEKKAELEKVYAEIEQGRKLKAVGRLASGVAHEVNNPLATISTYTQLLLRRRDIPSDAAGSLHKVMTEIERIQGKLRNLLDLSRLQSVVRTEVNPNDLVHDVAELATHEARAQKIDLTISLDPNPRPFHLDQSGFKQVLWNLLGNAIAAQGPGGSVRVRTRFAGCGEETGCAFILEVEDEGPGIPDEVLPYIFDPFFTTREVGKGTGLGLAVVNSIIEGHSGKIEVHNLDEGGCRFRIVFPEGEQA